MPASLCGPLTSSSRSRSIWIPSWWSFLSLVLLALSVGCGGGSTNAPAPKTLLGIAVSPDSATIAPGATQQFKATATYGDGSTADVTSSATWSSSASGVATVNSSGVATGVAAGSATVTATIGTASGTASLTVSAAAPTLSSIAITPATADISAGATQQFTATGTYSDGSTNNISSSVTWTSSSTSIVTINASGLATGVAAGTATITATMNGVSATASMTVAAASGPTVSSIQIKPATATVAVGSTNQFTATATYSDGSQGDVSTSATWQSSSSAIVTVNSSGLATGVAAGTATITASLGGVSGTASITVASPVQPVITSITVAPASASISASANTQFTAKAHYSDDTTADITSQATWTSSNTAVATVNSAGMATGVAAGTVTITAAFSGVSGTASLTVTAAPPQAPTLVSITVTPPSADLNVGKTFQFTATGTYSDQSTSDLSSKVTWSTGSAKIATISSTGVATGVSAGTTTVTATMNGVSGTASVTVATPAPIVSSIAVTPATATLNVGATQQFTATATYSGGTTSDVTKTATWSSSNTAAATVSSSGMVTAAAAGTATITATVNGVSGTSAVTVQVNAPKSIAITPNPASLATGTTEQFTATATYADGSTADVTSTATWKSSDTSVATIAAGGLATGVAAGQTTITAASNGVTASITATVTVAAASAVNITTWHVDNNRSGLNSGETSLTPATVSSGNFGKLFSYEVDGYVYGEPLIVSNLTINGAKHNVLFVATEKDTVYAFDSDSYGSGAPLWQTSLLQGDETPLTGAPIQPYQGVTSTPVIDTSTNTIYVISEETSASTGGTIRLNALDLTTGQPKFGSPMTIDASMPGTNPTMGNGTTVTLTTACMSRAALLLANGNVYIGIGGCPTGWLLAYNATTLAQVAIWNASPNIPGEGQYASAGGIWMGSGGPVADSQGNIYVATGNGPWDGNTAWGDSVIKFSPTLQIEDYFTPQDYAFMDCNDSDLAAGGLLMIPGSNELVVGGKPGKMYLLNSANLGKEQTNDAGATQTLWYESDLSSPYSATCPDPQTQEIYTADINSYEIFGTSAYFNGYVYLGITPTSSSVTASVRQFQYAGGKLIPGAYTSPNVQQNTRGTTPFISSNGNQDGIVWMIDEGTPLQEGTPTAAILRAYDAAEFPNQLYNSSQNAADTAGYGIKFTSPVVANGKVYMSTGHDPVTATNPQGEIDVYGLK